MRRALHIVLVLLVAAACQGPRIIPKGTLTDIYEDMFLADQMVREENMQRDDLDSLLLYEAVFEKYGYDTDDYFHSLRYYLKDPERFAKVFEEVATRLQGQANALEPIIQHQDWVAQRMGAKRPQIDSILAAFSKDSVYVGLARVARDSSRYPAWFRLVGVRQDTLMAPVDTAKVEEAPADTLAKEEPVAEEPDLRPVEEPELEPDRPIRGKLRPQRHQGQILEEKMVEEEIAEEVTAE